MKKIIIAIAIFSFISGCSLALAHSQTEPLYGVLEVKKPNILPGDPFYFLKELGRGVRLFFAFDTLKKAEIELIFLDEKLVEFDELAKTASKESALEKALNNYLAAHERLASRLESLREKNKNIDGLLEKLADRVIEHQRFFNTLEERVTKEKLEKIDEAIVKISQKALELEEKKFKEKLEDKARRENSSGDGLNIIKMLNQKLNNRLSNVEEKLKEDGSKNKKAAEETGKPEICIEIYDPVCGADEKTYSNECFAKIAQVKIKYEGECKNPQKLPPVDEPPRPPLINSGDSDKNLWPSVNPKINFTEYTVEIKESGFIPDYLKIKRGDLITWVNKSGQSVWPASGPHPTHDLYPEFDSKRGLAPGESFSLQFQKLGTWGYHNHLYAQHTGIVEVVE